MEQEQDLLDFYTMLMHVLEQVPSLETLTAFTDVPVNMETVPALTQDQIETLTFLHIKADLLAYRYNKPKIDGIRFVAVTLTRKIDDDVDEVPITEQVFTAALVGATTYITNHPRAQHLVGMLMAWYNVEAARCVNIMNAIFSINNHLTTRHVLDIAVDYRFQNFTDAEYNNYPNYPATMFGYRKVVYTRVVGTADNA